VRIGDSGAAVTGYETSGNHPEVLGKARRRSEARSQNNGPRDQLGNFAPKEIALCVVPPSTVRI
jgi:hypothetical protein